jgi:hypothetical protein
VSKIARRHLPARVAGPIFLSKNTPTLTMTYSTSGQIRRSLARRILSRPLAAYASRLAPPPLRRFLHNLHIMYSDGFSEMKKSHRRRMCPLPPPTLVTQFCYIHQVKCHMEMSRRRVYTCMYSKYIHNDPRGMSVLSLVGMT